jgi:dCTP deaminase
MILTGAAISKAVANGDIRIDPYDPRLVNPNSYNYRLSPTLRFMGAEIADPLVEGSFRECVIPPDGLILEPGRVYLGTTVEAIGSSVYVPSLIGRSSLGRLGLFLQVSADLGQLGAFHCWTLEIVAVQPIRIYAGMRIGQVSFWVPQGGRMRYSGFYGRRSYPALCDPAAMQGRYDPGREVFP